MNTDFHRYNILRALFLTGIMSDPTLAHARISATGKSTAHSISGQRNGAPMAAGGVGPNPQSLYANDTAVTATPQGLLLISRHRDNSAPRAPASQGTQGSVNIGIDRRQGTARL